MTRLEGPRFVKLPRIQKEMTQCQMCGYCIEVCEAHRQTPWESVTARGKIYYLNQLDKVGTGLMDKILGRGARLSPEFVDAVYKCTGCGNCEAVCHAKIKLVELWEKVRKWMTNEGMAPLPVHRKLERSIALNGNPYGEPRKNRDAWWPSDVKRTTPPEAIFFAGCTGSYRMQDIPRASVVVLDRAGVTVNCLGESEVCCTSPLLRTGIVAHSLEASKEVVSKADALGAKDMVMSCSGCYKTVSSNYIDYYGKPGQNVYHIVQYVDKLISERKLPLNNEFKARVTYHDPCHLGRHSKVYEEPRRILKKIKGIDFVEMERNREDSRCCGAGGGYKSAFNNFAVDIAAERVKDAEAVGAEVIATACPFCVLNLRQGAKKIGSKVKVMDITEILLQVTAPKIEEPVVKKHDADQPVPAVKADDEIQIKKTMFDDVEEDVEGSEMTPEAVIRRAMWIEGLRYRKDYGSEHIQFAFVKPKIAVFITETGAAEEHDKDLIDRGWIVLRYKSEDITDGKSQIAEIRTIYKKNLGDSKVDEEE
ncbi:MAG: 4Fe-4S dicluster domain-containing protein [archaeon]|nr:4Fe-4S dicluster domain-containing protein [archaeon]